MGLSRPKLYVALACSLARSFVLLQARECAHSIHPSIDALEHGLGIHLWSGRGCWCSRRSCRVRERDARTRTAATASIGDTIKATKSGGSGVNGRSRKSGKGRHGWKSGVVDLGQTGWGEFFSDGTDACERAVQIMSSCS